jgi:hypothetical protein
LVGQFRLFEHVLVAEFGPEPRVEILVRDGARLYRPNSSNGNKKLPRKASRDRTEVAWMGVPDGVIDDPL